MTRRRLGLRTAIVATVVAAVLATAVALALLAYLAVQRNAADYSSAESGDQRLSVAAAADTNAALAQIVTTYARGHPLHLTTQNLTSLVQRYVPNASVLDPNSGTSVCATVPCWPGLPTAARQAALAGKSFAGAGATEYSGRQSAAVTPLRGIGHNWSVAILVPLTPYRLTDTQLWQRMFLVLIVGVAFATIAGLAVGFSMRRRLHRIAAAARRFGQGDMDTRVLARGSEEIASLGESFNTMADQLNRTMGELHTIQARQRQFVADVAHELRSPLSTMTASLGGLDSPASATQRRAAELLSRQTRRLAGMVDDLLEISRFDAGQADLQLQTVDLTGLVVDAAQSVTSTSAIPVSTRGSANALVDPRRVHTVIRNLVSNALRHGVAPVSVEIDATRAEVVSIAVIDAGSGIRLEHVQGLFDRFSRGDKSRSSDDGSGLGLAIAQENATLHHGTITVSNSAPTKFILTLPREPNEPISPIEGHRAQPRKTLRLR